MEISPISAAFNKSQKEKRPALYPLIEDSVRLVYQTLIGVKHPVYVAGFDLGVLPIGDWLISIILSIFSVPCKLKFLSSLFNELFK